jgi:hypothetical protein
MRKRWILLAVILAATALQRQGWITIDWASIQRDLHFDAPKQIQDHSKDAMVRKAFAGLTPKN